MRSDDVPPVRYRIGRVLSRGCVRLAVGSRLEVEGAENVPAEGSLLVVCNHLSNLDPVVIGAEFPRTLYALAKREIYVNPPIAWFLAGCNCIPVERGGADRRALTRSLQVLRGGGRLLLFVEGTRSPDGRMREAEAGAGFLLRKSGATVLPTAVWGTEPPPEHPRRLRRSRIHLRFGRPVRLDVAGRDDRALAAEMAARIASLLPPTYRGVHAAAAAALGDG